MQTSHFSYYISLNELIAEHHLVSLNNSDIAAMQFPSTVISIHEWKLNFLYKCVLWMDFSLWDNCRVVDFQWPYPPYRSLLVTTHDIFDFPDWLRESGLFIRFLCICDNYISLLVNKPSMFRMSLNSQNSEEPQHVPWINFGYYETLGRFIKFSVCTTAGVGCNSRCVMVRSIFIHKRGLVCICMTLKTCGLWQALQATNWNNNQPLLMTINRATGNQSTEILIPFESVRKHDLHLTIVWRNPLLQVKHRFIRLLGF